MVSLVFFYILQLPHTAISNSEKLTHPNMHKNHTRAAWIRIHFPSWIQEKKIKKKNRKNARKKVIMQFY